MADLPAESRAAARQQDITNGAAFLTPQVGCAFRLMHVWMPTSASSDVKQQCATSSSRTTSTFQENSSH